MVRNISRLGAGLAMAASLSMAATPALADGWGGNNWGGRDGYHHRHHDSGAGTAAAIIAGLLVVGGIAAIASSNKHNRDRDDRDGYGVNEDTAVNNCASAVERNGDGVDSIDNVNRNGNGWRVEGRTGDGDAFSCSVSGSGAIYDLRVD